MPPSPRVRFWIIKLSSGASRPEFDDLPFQEAIYRKAYWSIEDKVINYFLRLSESQRASYFKINGLLSASPSSEEDFLDYDNCTDDFLGEAGYLGDKRTHGSKIHQHTPQDQSISGQQHHGDRAADYSTVKCEAIQEKEDRATLKERFKRVAEEFIEDREHLLKRFKDMIDAL